MWFYAIGALVIMVCLVALAAIVSRKLPMLTLIDTSSLPKERDAKKKKEIIHDRVSRATGAWGRRIADAVVARAERVREAFRVQYRKALLLEKKYRKEVPLAPSGVQEKVAALFAEAEAFLEKGEFGMAEKKYIEAISVDSRNPDAYRRLGELYFESKRLEQAKETFAFLVRMLVKERRCTHAAKGGAAVPDDRCAASAAAHAEIAKQELNAGLAAQALGDQAGARVAFGNAVVFEPSNPRHLDLLLDACILEGDKERAGAVFSQLQAVNPENGKLETLAQKIAALPDPVPQEKRRRRQTEPRRIAP